MLPRLAKKYGRASNWHLSGNHIVLKRVAWSYVLFADGQC